MFITVTKGKKYNKKLAHLTTAELINLWLTAIFSVFDRVVANRQTHAQHCIAAIGLAAYVSA